MSAAARDLSKSTSRRPADTASTSDPDAASRPEPGGEKPARLDPAADVVALAAALCDIPSESGNETAIADAVEHLLRRAPHLEV